MKTSAGRDSWADILLSGCEGKEREKNQFILGSRFECYRMESQICVSFLRQACHGATARAGSSSPPVNPVSFLGGGTFECLVQEEKEGRE